MTEQQKFEKLISELGISVYQLGKDLGYKRAEPLYKVVKGETKEMGATVYSKILRAYPTVNPEWLITGEGEVFKTPAATPPQIDTAAHDEVMEEVQQLREENRILQSMYERAVEKSVRATLPGKFKGGILFLGKQRSTFTVGKGVYPYQQYRY